MTEYAGINLWDWLALAAYLVVVTGIGLWTASKIKDTADFFMGGRGFGKISMIFFAFGAGTNGNQAVGVASKTYTNGLSGIWYQWLWLFATPFYWLIAPAFRRMRAITTGDYFEYRYSRSVAGLYTVVGVMQLTVNIGVMLLGSAKVIEAISGGAIPSTYSVIVMTILFVAYGMAGGLAAAIVTDLIQGILTVILSFMILPFALKAVGGFAGLHESITDESMFSLVAPGEINGWHISIFALNAALGIVTQPHIMGVCAAGRTEMDGRVGFAAGNLLKRVCTVAWMLTGLCGVVYFMNNGGDAVEPDQVYGRMAGELLPLVMPGLVGVFLAALLASVMSSCDAFMVSSAGLVTQNLYRRYLAPDRDEKHYVTVGRIAGLVIVTFSVFFAYTVEDIPSGLETFWKIQGMMAATFWVGLFWRRATPAGAWASTLGAFSVMLFTDSPMFHGWAAANLSDFFLWDGEFRQCFQMAAYLSTGFGLCIIVSLFTPRLPKAKLDRFYMCLHTPVNAEEAHMPEPFMLPEDVEPVEPRKLINHPDMEFPVPSLIGLGGFAFFWVCVGAMIWFVFNMAQWGA
ncbi:MAG: sodium:solute symporter family protein [Candidatus Hydrogenedentes bacterium]|nr:sodium:solute symporter family protein [Candidatus Hydrogenedentota bacterium]